MKKRTVDRTSELEVRLKAIKTGSEDTCAFWEKRADTNVMMRRCFYCKYYRGSENDEYSGFCKFKLYSGSDEFEIK